MNSRQTGVMWAGLLLVGIRMWTTGQWTQMWTTLVKPGTQQSSSPTAAQTESQLGSAGAIPVSFSSSGTTTTGSGTAPTTTSSSGGGLVSV